MEVTVLRSLQEVESIRAEWERFLRDDAGEHFVQHQPFFIAKRFEHATGPISPLIVVVRDGGIRCIAAFCRLPHRSGLRVGPIEVPAPTLTVLQPIENRIVHRKGSSELENIRMVLEGLQPYRHDFDAIWFEEVRVPGVIWDAFGEGKVKQDGFHFMVLKSEQESVNVTQLEGSYEKFLQSMSGRSRNARTRKLRKLREHCGNLALSTITEVTDVREFLDTANFVRNLSWKRDAFAPDRWKDERRIRFHEAIAERGWLRAYVLRCNESPIAYVLGYNYRGTFDLREMTYDESFRAHGPGAGLMLMIVEDLCKHFASCQVVMHPDDSQLKRTLSTQSYQMVPVAFVWKNAYYHRVILGLQRFLTAQKTRFRRMSQRITHAKT